MTEAAAKLEGVPVIKADPFSLENLAEPHALHEQLREAGPVVRLDHYGIWGMARYEQVNAALKDWGIFSSAAGAGLSDFRKEKPWRTPSLLLEADPPAHTRAREVVGPIMSPPALRALRGSIGAQIWAAADAGKIPEEWAPLLVRSLLIAVTKKIEPFILQAEERSTSRPFVLVFAWLKVSEHRCKWWKLGELSMIFLVFHP